MLQRFLIFVLLFINYFTYSQSKSIPDSLLNKSYKYLENKIKTNEIEDSLKSIYIDTYILKAKKEKDTFNIGQAFYYKTNEGSFYSNGTFYSRFNEEDLFKLGLTYSDSIIYYTKNLNNRIYPGLGYALKGYYLYNLGFRKDALDNYLIAYDYALRHDNEIQLPEIKDVINIIRNNLKSDYNESKKRLDSIKLLLKEDEKFLFDYLSALDNIISDLQIEKKYNVASDYIEEGIKKSIKFKNEIDYYNDFVFGSGINHYFLNNYKKALDSINKAEKKLSINSLPLAYYLKGKIYQEMDTTKAIKYFYKVDSIFNIYQSPFYGLRDNYKSLIDIYKTNGDYKKQIENIDKLIHADSIINYMQLYVEKRVLNDFEIPEYKKKKEQLILELEEKNSIKKRNITYLTILIILILLVGIYFFNKQSVYKKRYQSLLDEIENQNKLEETKEEAKVKPEANNLNIPEETIQTVLLGLENFEKNYQFLNNDITLSSLSNSLNTNSSYLSKIINTYKQKSFNNYLNELRINYVVDRLVNDKQLRKLTISAIASEVGFNNSESFSKAFYKKTGIYPSYFIKQIEKNHKISVI